MNTTTRRHPRTLTEAFGAHTSRYIYTEPTPMVMTDKIIVAAFFVALIVVMVLA